MLAPIKHRFTLLIHGIHLSEGHNAVILVITHLKCNPTNFEIDPISISVLWKWFWNLKIDTIVFQMGNNCTMSFFLVNFVDQKGETVRTLLEPTLVSSCWSILYKNCFILKMIFFFIMISSHFPSWTKQLLFEGLLLCWRFSLATKNRKNSRRLPKTLPNHLLLP